MNNPEIILELEKELGVAFEDSVVENIPMEIITQGKDAINQYLNEIQQVSKLFEAKVIVVGDGGVGKTSLIRKIISNTFDISEIQTQGIEINEWKIQTDNQNEITINFWDFGGQEIYYATHELFYTKNALYLLVVDSSRHENSVDYWINSINVHTNYSPILIVYNQFDVRTKKLDEYIIKKNYSNVIDVIKVNLRTNEGIDNLMKQIANIVYQLPHIGSVIPKQWFDIRHELKNIGKRYILWNEFEDICIKYNTKDERLSILSEYFHDIGYFIHFRDDLYLNNVIFLDFNWLVKNIYLILDNKEIISNYGIFTLSFFQKSLNSQISSYILQVMQKFEICYSLPNSTEYIIPQLLPADLPMFDWNYTNNLKYVYYYQFLPNSIISRLMVRLNNFIKHIFGRNGLLVETDKTKALIIQNKIDRKINISISGENKKELFAIIKYELEQIHSSFENLNIELLLACNCTSCNNSNSPVFYNYNNLIKRLEHEKVNIECENSFETINIKQLISGAIPQMIKNSNAVYNGNTLTDKHISFPKAIKHFTEIKINHYKALSGLNFQKLNQINLIAGLNDSGKTTLLEATYLLCSQNDYHNYIELQRMRGKYLKISDISLYHLKNHTPELIDIEGIYEERKVKSVIRKYEKIPEKNPENYGISYQWQTYVENDTSDKIAEIVELITDIHLFGKNLGEIRTNYKLIRNICKTEFYSPFIYQLREKTRDAHRQNVIKKNYEKIIQYFQNKVNNNIVGITLTTEDNDVRFKVNDNRFPEARDLTEFGDGMQRIFAIALQFAAVENGVLLIDELENAIDYKKLDEFAGFIIELALLFNVQVFLTSHSEECINAFFEYDAVDKLACYSLNNNEVRYFSGYDYDGLVQSLNADLRKIGGNGNE